MHILHLEETAFVLPHVGQDGLYKASLCYTLYVDHQQG